ncbi:hypothetical protein NTH51_002214 [Vibrio fluvialis]|nr:hypothetical protein [Vibrio fluvialis]
MKKPTLVMLISILLASLPAFSQEENNSDSDEIRLMLISAKMHGMCGLVHQMAQFQESTKLDGGDEFILRFMATELARLNMSSKDFLSACDKSADYYKYYFDLTR